MTYYAHSAQGETKDTWQQLYEHLESVAQLASKNASEFGAESLGYAAGLLHDLGKYTAEFQSRLKGGSRVDLATWGARICCERLGPLGMLLAYGIAGHHADLANSRDTEGRTSLQDRLRVPLPGLDPCWQQEIALPDASLVPLAGFAANNTRGQFQLICLGRMLFVLKRTSRVTKE